MQENIKSDLTRQKEKDHKNFVMEYFKLVGAGKFKEGLHFFAPDCKTHNPFISGSIELLIDAMVSANEAGASKYPEAEFI